MTVYRDLSLILLACWAFVIALVPLLLLGAVIYGLWQLQRHEHLPSWLKAAQAYLALGRSYIELAMAAIVRPILLVNSVLATIQGRLGVIVEFTRGRR